MALTRPTLTQLVDRVSTDFKNAISGATTLALRSVLQVMARVYAGAVHLLYGYIDNMAKQLFATTSNGIYLDLIGSEYAVIRMAATKAGGAVTCTGTVGTLIPAGSALQSDEGNEYVTDADATIGGGGSVFVNITASAAGAASNENAGVILTFVTPILNVDTTATVGAAGLTGGSDEEEDEDYRERILARKRFAPQGGCSNDYVTWAKEVAGVTRAWVYEQYNGVGTLAVYFVRDGDVGSIFPSAGEVAAVLAYLLSHVDVDGRTVGAPVTATPGLFVLAPVAKTVNLSIDIYPNTAAVQTAVQAELADLFNREGGPSRTIYLSQIREAISAATGELRHRLNVPVADVTTSYNEVHVLGTITWGSY